MSWRDKIEVQILNASKQHSIGPNLRDLGRLLLNGDTEFHLVYRASRDQYVTLRFVGEVGIVTRRLILKNYGAQTWKLLKP